MNYADMLIMECNGSVYGCRFNDNGEIEHYKQDTNGAWVLLSVEPLEEIQAGAPLKRRKEML